MLVICKIDKMAVKPTNKKIMMSITLQKNIRIEITKVKYLSKRKHKQFIGNKKKYL